MSNTTMRILAFSVALVAFLCSTQAVLPESTARGDDKGPVQPAIMRADRFGDPLPLGATARIGALRFRHEDSILVAAYAPRAISFAAGQAGFTVVLFVLFNLIQPTGWRVGLVRIEDVAIGFGVSLGVGLLFWPRS